MRLSDIINGPWAITPEMYTEIRGLYARHMRGEKIDYAILQQIAAANKGPRKADSSYEVVNGTAIIPVEGVIAKRMNIFMALCGGASTQLVERDIRAALSDESVKQLVLYIDSPGGTVDGTFELSNFIYQNRQKSGGKKKIIAFTDGMMYSGGYALASAADEILISSDTNGLGSIGVVATHDDYSKQNEMRGVKTTEIYAGKYKRIASQEAPLTPEGYQSIKDEVDYLYSIFVNTVARNRGVSVENVLTKMSTDVKGSFLGKQAIEAGLADGMSTLDEIVNGKMPMRMAGGAMRADDSKRPLSQGEGQPAAAGGAEAQREETIMDVKELQEKHPDLYQSVLAEGKTAGMEEGKAQGRTEGAAAESGRIKSVYEVGKMKMAKGHEGLLESVMFDGKTTAADAKVRIADAHEAKLAAKAEDIKEDGKDLNVPPSQEAEGAAKIMKRAEFDKLAPAAQAAHIQSGGKVTD